MTTRNPLICDLTFAKLGTSTLFEYMVDNLICQPAQTIAHQNVQIADTLSFDTRRKSSSRLQNICTDFASSPSLLSRNGALTPRFLLSMT